MPSKKLAVAAIAFLALAITGFTLSHFVASLLLKAILFIAGAMSLLAGFASVIEIRKSSIDPSKPDVFFNICMVVIACTFSFLLYYSDSIVAFDIFALNIPASAFTVLTTFIVLVYCSIALFKPLRQYGSSFYTACFTVSLSTLSTAFFLFEDYVPNNDFFNSIRLFLVIGSLSLALSLLMLEYDKRKKENAVPGKTR